MYKANWLNSKSPLVVYFNSALSALGLYGCKNFLTLRDHSLFMTGGGLAKKGGGS